MLPLITYMHDFNEQCVVLVIFSWLCFFLITLLKCALRFFEPNNKNVGLYLCAFIFASFPFSSNLLLFVFIKIPVCNGLEHKIHVRNIDIPHRHKYTSEAVRLLESDKSFSSLCMLTPVISSRLTSLNSTKMPTTSKCISSVQTSPLNSACPIAYLTFPPGWVPDPKWNSQSSPIPTQDALLRRSVISVNGNIIFLLAQTKCLVILDSSFLSPSTSNLYWNLKLCCFHLHNTPRIDFSPPLLDPNPSLYLHLPGSLQ